MICICGVVFTPPLRKRGEVKRHCSGKCKMKAWRAEKKELANAAAVRDEERRRALRKSHPEIFKAREAARYAADPAGQRARVAAYRLIPENRKHGNAVVAVWRAANPEKNRAAVRRWESEHPEMVAQYNARRYARRAGNGGSHTLTEWRDKCEAFGNMCAYCGESKPLSRDHDIPLSRGGTDDIANIIPACRLCNSKKRHRTSVEYFKLLRA